MQGPGPEATPAWALGRAQGGACRTAHRIGAQQDRLPEAGSE